MLLMPTTTVTVITRPTETRDRQNNRVYDWSTATRTVYPAHVRLLASQEARGAQDQVVTEVECHLPPDAAITVYDRVEVAGAVHEVDGDIQVLGGYGPLAALNQKVAVLKRVTG